MRLSRITLLALLMVFPRAWAQPENIEFRGILEQGESRVFSLSKDGGTMTAWVEEGGLFAGFEIVEFRSRERVLVLRKDGEDYLLSLGPGRVARGDINSESALVHASNLRQITQAALIFANDNREQMPGGDTVETIHDVARLLALGGGLNDATHWIAEGDATSGAEEGLTTVMNRDRTNLDPVFARQNVIAIDFATGLNTKMRSTTPVAWTRGLREDGSWDEQGAYGSTGGFIAFLGGNVAKYEKVSNNGGVLVRPDGTRTSNILEALPPEARVAGAGPKTLDGATGAPVERAPE